MIGIEAAIATVSYGRTAATRKVTEQLYRRTLELDPGLAATWANLAGMALQYDWDWGRAEREYQAALANGPDHGADGLDAVLLIDEGRFAEADDHLLRSQDLNPLGSVRIILTAMGRDLEGRFEDARAEWQRALSLHPDTLLARVGIDVVDIEEGRTGRALADLKVFYTVSPWRRCMRRWLSRARAGGTRPCGSSVRRRKNRLTKLFGCSQRSTRTWETKPKQRSGWSGRRTGGSMGF